jgi:heptose I phosphotransferase
MCILELSSFISTFFPGQDAFNQILNVQGEVYRSVANRRTLRVELGGQGFFFKVHKGIGWKEIAKNLLHFRLPVTGARNEWLAIRRLEELNIATMKIAGFGERGVPPARLQSFLITDELINTVSLEDFCREWPAVPPPAALKRALIEKVATIAKTLHNNGVNHRDFYICHFLLELATLREPYRADRLTVYVIDLHRVQTRQRTPRRWLEKDVAALHFSSMAIGLTKRDRLRFMKAYRDRPLRRILAGEQSFWQNVERKAQTLNNKGVRG